MRIRRAIAIPTICQLETSLAFDISVKDSAKECAIEFPVADETTVAKDKATARYAADDRFKGIMRLIEDKVPKELVCFKTDGNPYGRYKFHHTLTPVDLNPTEYKSSNIGYIKNMGFQTPSTDIAYRGLTGTNQIMDNNLVHVLRKFCNALSHRANKVNELNWRAIEEVQWPMLYDAPRMRSVYNVIKDMGVNGNNVVTLEKYGLNGLKRKLSSLTFLGYPDIQQIWEGFEELVEKAKDDENAKKIWFKTLLMISEYTNIMSQIDSGLVEPGWKGTPVGWSLSKRSSNGGIFEIDTRRKIFELNKILVPTNIAVILSAKCRNCDGTDGIDPFVDVVIKYTNNCKLLNAVKTGDDESIDTDPSSTEFLTMKVLRDLRVPVVLNVYSLSAPVMVFHDGKMNFDDDRIKSLSVIKSEECKNNDSEECDDFKECKNEDATVRAIIEEKLDYDLFDQFTEHLPNDPIKRITLAITNAIETLKLLILLHKAGYIHGDIHAGNVGIIINPKTQVQRYVLFDLGFSKFYPLEIGLRLESKEIDPTHNPALLASGQLRGEKMAGRDDVERCIEMIAELLALPHGNCFSKAIDSLGDMKELIDFKSHQPYFTEAYAVSSGQNFTFCQLYGFTTESNKCVTTMEHLNQALADARTVQHPDDRPPYEQIMQSLEAARNAIDAQ